MKLEQVFSSTEDLDEVLSTQEMEFLNGGVSYEASPCERGGKCKNGGGCANGGGCSRGGSASSFDELSAW